MGFASDLPRRRHGGEEVLSGGRENIAGHDDSINLYLKSCQASGVVGLLLCRDFATSGRTLLAVTLAVGEGEPPGGLFSRWAG